MEHVSCPGTKIVKGFGKSNLFLFFLRQDHFAQSDEVFQFGVSHKSIPK